MVLTLTGMEELLLKKLNNTRLPEGWEKEVKEYIKLKEHICFKDGKGVDIGQLVTANTMNHFLQKDSLESYGLPLEIHPGGDIKNGFVIEPLKRNWFVYNWCGMRGACQVMQYPDSKRYYVNIHGLEIPLIDSPIQEFAYELPNEKIVNRWIRGTMISQPTTYLWDKIDRYFRVFLDLQQDCFYKVLPLFVFQSWMQDILPVVFYLNIGGAWGGGKTTAGELTIYLCKHGLFADPSVAVVARSIDRQKVSIFIDELDSISVGSEDSDLYSIIRKGYRKGAKYVRMSNDNAEARFYDVFGAKLFTAHTGIEQALQTRSIPIPIVETQDSQLPRINILKMKFSKPLLEELYLWYLDNSIVLLDYIDGLDYNIRDTNNIEEIRKGLDGALCGRIGVKSSKLVNSASISGRNVELAFIMTSLIVKLGVKFTNEDLIKIFDAKKQIEDERYDVGYLGNLREYLIELYNTRKFDGDYVTEDGTLKISNKEMYNSFNTIMKTSDRGAGVSPQAFQGHLREFGFERPLSRKKLTVKIPTEEKASSRLCNVFTNPVLKKLGIKYEKLEIQGPLEVSEEQIE